ncbi:MAG: hypothetical protein ABLT11_10960 [Candidatus Acidiferrum sp.]
MTETSALILIRMLLNVSMKGAVCFTTAADGRQSGNNSGAGSVVGTVVATAPHSQLVTFCYIWIG